MTEIKKNSAEKLRIERTNFKGYDLVSMRIYYQDKAGEYQPSPKGFAFKVELVNDIIAGLKKEGSEKI